MKANRHLVVFAKSPVLGRVKTRLGRDIGAVAATRFYRQTVNTVLNRLANDGRWRCWLALRSDRFMATGTFWPSAFSAFEQGAGDIGQRMDTAMRAIPPGPVVIVGTDVPDIRPFHIEAAFRALGHHDAVFGPAVDGGYWLVGARRSPKTPDLFSGVRWSSPHTLSDSLTQTQRGNLTVALLETLDDIDDAISYRKRLRL